MLNCKADKKEHNYNAQINLFLVLQCNIKLYRFPTNETKQQNTTNQKDRQQQQQRERFIYPFLPENEQLVRCAQVTDQEILRHVSVLFTYFLHHSPTIFIFL